MNATGQVISTIEDGIATITFGHPQSNSLPGALLRKLAEEIKSAGLHQEAKVIVLKSEGEKTFCAGASFDELIAIDSFEKGKLFFSGFALVLNAIRTAPKFVIARVQGKAVGGGVGIAAAADYTIATDAAAIKLSELAVGIGPFVVGPAVERKIGTGPFAQLTINATEFYPAEWAKNKSLYTDVFPSITEADKAVHELAAKLAQSSPEAMRMLKRVLWEGTENWDTLLFERAEMSGKLVLSDFTVKAINSFKAKA